MSRMPSTPFSIDKLVSGYSEINNEKKYRAIHLGYIFRR
jgi:hypothetical protein